MNLARLLLPSAFALVLPIVATAQPDPANFRDGCVSGTVDPPGVDVVALTVPDGKDFVLTDIQFDGAYAPFIIGDAGELRWMRVGAGGVGTRSWATGLRFAGGQAMRLRLSSTASPSPFTVCWSGYLTPTATTSVIGGDAERHGFRIGPNPTTGGATLWFRLDRDGPIKLAIYDAQGRVVRGLKSGRMRAGEQAVRWDGRDRNGRSVDAGLYFARLETAGERSNAKIVRVE